MFGKERSGVLDLVECLDQLPEKGLGGISRKELKVQPCRRLPDILEGMGHAAGNMDGIAGTRFVFLSSQVEAESPFNDVENLALVAVGMNGRSATRRHRFPENGDHPRGLLGPDQTSDIEGAHVRRLERSPHQVQPERREAIRSCCLPPEQAGYFRGGGPERESSLRFR